MPLAPARSSQGEGKLGRFLVEISRLIMAVMRVLGLASVLVASLGWAQTLDVAKPVDYKTVAAPSARAIAEISKVSGVPIRILAPVDSEPLILRFDHVPLKQALDKICFVLHASWAEEKGLVTISRPPALAQRLAEEEAAADKAALVKQMDGEVKDALDKPVNSNDLEQILAEVGKLDLKTDAGIKKRSEITSRVEGRDGGDYLLARVIPYLNLDDLLHANPVVVFSTTPKPLQRPLAIPAAALQQIVDEQNMWADFSRRYAKLMPDDPLMGKANGPSGPLDAADARIVVTYDGILDVNLLDGTGRVFSAGVLPGPGESDDEPVPGEAAVEDRNFEPVPLSAMATEFVSLARVGSTFRQPSAELRNFLLHPEKFDPLSLAASETILGAAEQKGLNLVACPSDDAASPPYDEVGNKGDFRNYFIAEEQGGRTVSLDGRWILDYASEPFDSEKNRMKRSDLGAFVRGMETNPYPTVDEIANFVAANPYGDAEVVLRLWTQVLHADDRLAPVAGSREGLQLWGNLSRAQKEQLLQGASIPYRQLPTAVMDLLSAEVHTPRRVVPNEPDWPGLVGAPMPGMAIDDKFWDITEVIDTVDGNLRAVRRPNWVIRYSDPSDPGEWRMETPYQIAALIHKLGVSGLRVACMPVETYDIFFDLMPGLSLHFVASQAKEGMGPVGRYSDLPEELRKIVDADVVEVGIDSVGKDDAADPTESGDGVQPPSD
jgi:hypothetical protein